MRNNIGFYIGFSIFAIQTIVGELYRDSKMKRHNENYNKILERYK